MSIFVNQSACQLIEYNDLTNLNHNAITFNFSKHKTLLKCEEEAAEFIK